MYDAKGRAPRDRVIEQHIPLVKKLAYQLKARLPANVEVDDLIQAGTIGLLDAMSRYEATQNAQFETYAVQRIRGAMLDELRSQDWLPRSVRQNMRQIEAALGELQQELLRAPSEAEIAARLQLSLEDYQQKLNDGAGHQLVYFDDFKSAGDDGHDHFLDRHCQDSSHDPLQQLLQDGFREALIEAIDALPEREKLLMGLYYEQELNLKEIGAVLGVTESRVSQLHSQAVARLRNHLRRQEWTGAV